MQKTKKNAKRLLAVLLSVLMLAGCMAVSVVNVSAAIAAPDYVGDTENSAWAMGTSKTTDQNIEAVRWEHIDGKYYWFLPSSANLNSLVIYHHFKDFTIEGNKVDSGSYKVFPDVSNAEYNITIEGVPAKLVIQKASGIGSLFLTTQSGTMDNINKSKDKSVKEKGKMVAIDADGTVSYDSTMKQIKGRGNSTWRLDKKPYNISLDDNAELFGLGKSKKWCLLANAQDHSMLRNRFIYDLASEVGLLAPGSEFADVYANGKYLGTYQVSEKVEVGKNNLVKINDLEGETEKLNDKDLDSYNQTTYNKNGGRRTAFEIPNSTTEGGYLVEFVVDTDEVCNFTTSRGQGVNLKGPEYLSVAQMDRIADFIEEMEEAVFSATGKNSLGKHYTEYIDEEDAALMYLIQEYSMNMDAGISSCYFYVDFSDDGLLHAGPAWDFDITLGNIDMYKDGVSMVDYDQWFVNKSIRSGSNKKSIWSALYQHGDFAELAEQLWETTVNPALDVAFGEKAATGTLLSLTAYSKKVEASSVMNYTIWSAKANSPMTDAGTTHKSHLDYMIDWAGQRRDFLNTAEWNVDPDEDKVVYFDNNQTNWNEVYVYTWGGDTQMSWPGVKMTEVADGIYTYTAKANDVSIIFNNGKKDGEQGKEQTKDLTIPGNNYIFTIDPGSANVDGDRTLFEGKWSKYTQVTPNPEVVYGDLDDNGLVEIEDALIAHKIVAQLITPTEEQLVVGDVDGSGEIDITDALYIRQHVAKLITVFAVEK